MKLFFRDARVWWSGDRKTVLKDAFNSSRVWLTVFFFNLVSFGDWRKISPARQQKLAMVVGLTQKKYRLVRRLTDPAAIEIICDMALKKISAFDPLIESHLQVEYYFNSISDFLINPAMSPELLDRMLLPELRPSWDIVRALGERRFQNVTVPIVKKITNNGENLERVAELIWSKYIYLASLPVVFFLYTVSTVLQVKTSSSPKLNVLEEAIATKLKTRTWAEAVNLILSCNGYNSEDLNSMPLTWRESLLKTIENPQFPQEKIPTLPL